MVKLCFTLGYDGLIMVPVFHLLLEMGEEFHS